MSFSEGPLIPCTVSKTKLLFFQSTRICENFSKYVESGIETTEESRGDFNNMEEEENMSSAAAAPVPALVSLLSDLQIHISLNESKEPYQIG